MRPCPTSTIASVTATTRRSASRRTLPRCSPPPRGATASRPGRSRRTSHQTASRPHARDAPPGGVLHARNPTLPSSCAAEGLSPACTAGSQRPMARARAGSKQRREQPMEIGESTRAERLPHRPPPKGKELLKRLIGPSWQRRAHRLSRLRWLNKLALVRQLDGSCEPAAARRLRAHWTRRPRASPTSSTTSRR